MKDYKTYLLLSKYDESKQLIFKTFHCHGEVDDWSLCTNLWRVRWIAKLCGNIQSESGHNVNLFFADLDLEHGTGFDEVLLEQVVKGRVQFLADVFNE